MNIGEVAEKTGFSAHTIRFYEKSGLLPKVGRTESGIRVFTDSDVTFLTFIGALRKTGMSLEDITEFTEDGCILERLQNGEMPAQPVARRLMILQKHKEYLNKQRDEIEQLIDAVEQKLEFYEFYLSATAGERQER